MRRETTPPPSTLRIVSVWVSPLFILFFYLFFHFSLSSSFASSPSSLTPSSSHNTRSALSTRSSEKKLAEPASPSELVYVWRYFCLLRTCMRTRAFNAHNRILVTIICIWCILRTTNIFINVVSRVNHGEMYREKTRGR